MNSTFRFTASPSSTNTFSFPSGTGMNSSFRFHGDRTRNTYTLNFQRKTGMNSSYTVSGGDSDINLTFTSGTGLNSTLIFMGASRSSAVCFEGYSFARSSTMTVDGQTVTRTEVNNGVETSEVFENGQRVSAQPNSTTTQDNQGKGG